MNVKRIWMQLTSYLFNLVVIIQIIFGVVYVGANLFSKQMLQGSKEYFEISKTLVTDEYIGILYPLLLRIPFVSLIYIIQLAAAGIAVFLFFRQLLQNKKSVKDVVIPTLFIMTIPMLLQLHMTLLPNSLALTTMVLFITFWLKEDGWKNSLAMGILLIVAALLVPDTLFMTLVLSLIKILQNLYRKKIEWKSWLLIFISVILAVSIGTATQTPGSRGRIQKTFWAAMFQRTVSEYFSQSFMVWDVRVQQTFTIEEFMECAKRSDNMMYVAGPKLEEKWGKATANELYKKMTLDCTRIRTRQVVTRIRDDMIDSVLMPFSVLWQKNAVRRSATGFNYDGFRQNLPKMSTFYFYYGIYAEILLVITGVIRYILNHRKRLYGIGILLIASLIQVIVAVMSTGNAVDYTGLWMMILWWGVLSACFEIE